MMTNLMRNLDINDWRGYFFEEMINILDIYSGSFMVNDTKQFTDGRIIYNICYNDKIGVSHIVFNNIDCYFKKDASHSDYSSLIFCDNNKIKNIIDIYFKIIKQLKNEVFSFIDEFEDYDFVCAADLTKFRFIKNDNVIDYDDDDDDDYINHTSFKFKTDDNLVYYKKINTPICVISISSVIKKDWIYFPIIKLQKCLYESFS